MEIELEQLLKKRLQALEAANRDLWGKQQSLTAELRVVDWLKRVVTQLTSSRNTAELYEVILDTLVAVGHSDFASLQMFHPERGAAGELRLLGHRGFSAEAARHWEWVRPATGTTCGEALRILKRVAVPDVRKCQFIAASEELEAYLGTGIVAVQTTPLVSRSGALVGAFSTHWREPHEMHPTELQALDVLARLASDLIERTRTEEALRRSANFQAAVTRNMGEGLYTLDSHGCVTSMNPAAEDLFGWTAEELRGRRMHDLTHYQHRDGSPFPIEQCAGFGVLNQGRMLAAHEDVFIRKDGTFFDVVYSSSPLRDPDGAVQGVVVVFRDVTEKKVAEESLRENEERFRKYFELGLIGMAITSPTRGILEVNDEACKILGYERAELLGTTWSGVTHPEDIPSDIAQFDRVLAGEVDGYCIHKRFIRKDGEIIHATISVQCLRNADGSIRYAVGLLQDITERKRAIEALKGAHAELEQRVLTERWNCA